MAAILKDDPAASLPRDLPPALERILGRCLEKTRDSRFQSARDLAFGLDVLSRTDLSAAVRAPRFGWIRARTLPWAIVTILAATLVGGLALWSPWRSIRSPRPLRLSVDLGRRRAARTARCPIRQRRRDIPRWLDDRVHRATKCGRAAAAVRPTARSRLHAIALARHRRGQRAVLLTGRAVWLGFDTGRRAQEGCRSPAARRFVLADALISMRGAAWGAGRVTGVLARASCRAHA